MKQGELELDRNYINRLENHIKELELRLSLSDSALDEYKEEVKYMESKTCEGCKYWVDCVMHDLYVDALDTYNTDIKTLGVSCQKYEPKDK